jgi:hypothetical protein
VPSYISAVGLLAENRTTVFFRDSYLPEKKGGNFYTIGLENSPDQRRP